MEQVNIHEAKTNLSKLIAKAVAGEPFVIAKAGKPLVKVVRIDEPELPPKKSRLGMLEGKIRVPDDIKTPFKDEIEAMFYGNPDKVA
ncbi:MAG: type II toxin-antitoxin system prevent-host-death family antitoxin [Sphingomonadales bacterium]